MDSNANTALSAASAQRQKPSAISVREVMSMYFVLNKGRFKFWDVEKIEDYTTCRYDFCTPEENGEGLIGSAYFTPEVYRFELNEEHLLRALLEDLFEQLQKTAIERVERKQKPRNKGGRPTNSHYDVAFQRMQNGMGYTEAYSRYCQEAGIDPREPNGFRAAMNYRKEKHAKGNLVSTDQKRKR
jgi:hypothetical protein